MTDLISRLAEIRELQGREPLPDPSKIQGFDPQALPSEEPYPVRPPVDLSQVPDGPDFPDLDEEMDQDESPLIPREPEISRNFPVGDQPQPILPAPPDLAVAGYGERCIGSVQGREVELSVKDQAAIKQIVLKALEREVRGHIAALQASLPKRKRKVRANTGTSPEETPQTGLPPKKRGRPRKRLDGSIA